MSDEDSKKLFILGGLPFHASKNISSSSISESGNIEQGDWTIHAPIPEPRSYFSVAVLDGKIYVIGGRNAKKEPSNDIFCYNILTNEWKLVHGVQTKYPRSESGCGAIDKKIYIVGGYGPASRSVECFDIEKNKMTEKSGLSRGKWGHSVVSCRGRIYSLGGQWYNYTDSDPRSKRSSTIYLNDVESYDPICDTWKREETMLRRRGYFGAAVSGEYIYAIGGMGGEANTRTVKCLDSIERFNTLNGQWSIIDAKLNHPRSNASVCIGNKILYVLGGNGTRTTGETDDRENSKRSILDTIEIIQLNESKNENTNEHNGLLPRQRHSFCAVLI